MASTVRTLFAASLIGSLPLATLRAQNDVAAAVSATAGRDVRPKSEPVGGLIDVKTSDVLSTAFIRAVARVGKPSPITLAGEQTVRHIIEARCGVVSPAYVAAFLDENREAYPDLPAQALEAPAPAKTFQFPFCVRATTIHATMPSTIGGLFKYLGLTLDERALDLSRKSKSIPARPLETLKLFGPSEKSGSDGGFVSTELSRKFFRDNPMIDPRQTLPGTSLFVTTPEATATVPLRTGVSGANVRADFVANHVPGTLDQAQVADLIGDEALLPNECENVVKGAWPFPSVALAEAIRRVKLTRPGKISRPAEVKVMTVDTGYDPAFGMPAIDANLFGYLRGPGSGGLMDRVGMNANDELADDATPPDALDQRQHGGEVAATLLGGAFLERIPPVVTSPRISFVSIAALNASGTPYLDIGGIGEAMLIARRSDVRIINASVSAIARSESFLRIIANDDERLIVAAAGNSRTHSTFDSGNKPWPGSMGGLRSNAKDAVIISVGASDPDGNILAFSRIGPQVDLFAPGCRIPTYTLKDGHVTVVERSGTSYAAPLVSLVASQLALEGLTPPQIKDRLIISAEVDERTARKSYSGGRLDAVRALSLWRDIVVFDKNMADGTTVPTSITGKLASPFIKVDICGQAVTYGDLRKLVLSRKPGLTPGPGNWRGWFDDGLLQQFQPCPEASGAVTGMPMEFEREDGTLESIELASIRSFIARFK